MYRASRWMVVAVWVGCVSIAQPLCADETADKQKALATEAAEKFFKARLENDLDALLAVTDVPFAGIKGAGTDKASPLTVLTTRAELKESLQNLLAKTKITEKKLAVKELWTFADFNKTNDLFVLDLLQAVSKQLDLRKDDIVIKSQEDRFYIIRIREGSAKLAVFFR